MFCRYLGQIKKENAIETLTTMLLSYLNYSDIVTNRISYGGHEIDVEANFRQPSIGQPVATRLICECKAHDKPIDTTNWLKFLGKIFTEELSANTPVSGLMIALTGVNGNVAGQYAEVKKQRTDIQIVTGEDLTEKLKLIYPLRKPNDVSREIYESTTRTVTTLELAYYERHFIYIASFSDNTYTTISANRKNPSGTLDELVNLVAESGRLGERIDLSADREFANRQDRLQKIILTALLSRNCSSSYDEIIAEWKSLVDVDVEQCDLIAPMNDLIQQGIVTKSENQFVLAISTDPSVNNRVNFLRRINHGPIMLPALKLHQYDDLIDDDLLVFMESNHNCTPVPDEERESLIQIFKWSPSALNGAIILPNRSQQSIENEDHLRPPDDFAYVVLRQQLIERFINEFHTKPLHEYFRVHCGIHELEMTRNIAAKSNTKIELEFKLHQRLGIMPAAESLGGGHILVTMKLENPEPWEPWPTPPESSE